MLNGSSSRRRRKTAFIDQRAVTAGKNGLYNHIHRVGGRSRNIVWRKRNWLWPHFLYCDKWREIQMGHCLFCKMGQTAHIPGEKKVAFNLTPSWRRLESIEALYAQLKYRAQTVCIQSNILQDAEVWKFHITKAPEGVVARILHHWPKLINTNLVLDVWKRGESCCICLMISEMAGPIWVKLSRIVVGGQENDLAKEFFEKM